MPRPKLLNIDPNEILAAIVRDWLSTLASIAQERAEQQALASGRGDGWTAADLAVSALDRERKFLERYGLEYDVPRWLGRHPTPSERVTAQKAIRGLEAKGLVAVFGAKARYIQPTPAGVAAVEGAANA